MRPHKARYTVKKIQVNGKIIKARGFKDAKAQIRAMGLDAKAFGQAMAAASAAFPKKIRTTDASKGRGTQQVQRASAGPRTEVAITRLQDNGIRLQVLTGPSKAVLKEVRGNKNARNLLHAEIQTHVVGKDPQATVVLLEGNVDRAKAGSVSKEMLAPFINQVGFSRLSGVKAIKAFGQHGYAPIGENLNKENVRRFVQALVAVTYNGTALRGAKMGGEEISTNIFLATDAKVRQMAWWPAKQPGNYGVLVLAANGGALSLSYLGTYGLFGIAANGQAFTASFEDAIKAAAVAQVESKVAVMPWKDLALTFDGKMGMGTFEASVASSIKDAETQITTGYTVYVTGKDHLAIVELSQKDASITAKVKETVPFQNDMAVLGFANDGTTVVTANLNGGPNLFGFRPIEELGLKTEHLPAGIIAARKVRADRIAAKQTQA